MTSFVPCTDSFPRPVVARPSKKKALGPLPASLLQQIIKRTVIKIAGPATELVNTPR